MNADKQIEKITKSVKFEKVQFTSKQRYDGLWRIDHLFDEVYMI